MKRNIEFNHLKQLVDENRVVAVLGPRQCGKTTLARKLFSEINGPRENYFDLENPTDLHRLSDPMLALEDLTGLIVIDEIQRRPDLFPALRFLVDREENSQKYLILGSVSQELLQQSSESLAGRIHYLELTPFSLIDQKSNFNDSEGDSKGDDEKIELEKLWLRGGLPLSYLARTEASSLTWRKNYIRTFLEGDIPNLGIKIPASQLRRFWMMLCHYHGGLLNASEIGNVLGVSHHTVQNYIDILGGTFMIRQLNPWYEKISKRQVKSRKIYFRDTGIYHALMSINDKAALLAHPKIGASWEGFALEEVIRTLAVDSDDCFFWATHTTAELDLLILKDGKRLGFEFKFSKMPKVTRSMHVACEDLQLDALTVIYPGDVPIRLSPDISALGLEAWAQSCHLSKAS